LFKNLLLMLLCFTIIVGLSGCYNDYKYKPGKDTVAIFGDGKFQILSGPTSNSLTNYEADLNIEYIVYKYKEIKPLVYVIGESGYTILNYKTGQIRRYKKLKEIEDPEQQIFIDLAKK
jgi:hypothetical protein